jgi:hypothetical protein
MPGARTSALWSRTLTCPETSPDGDVAKHVREINVTLPVIYVSAASAHDWGSKGVPQSKMISKPLLSRRSSLQFRSSSTKQHSPPNDGSISYSRDGGRLGSRRVRNRPPRSLHALTDPQSMLKLIRRTSSCSSRRGASSDVGHDETNTIIRPFHDLILESQG